MVNNDMGNSAPQLSGIDSIGVGLDARIKSGGSVFLENGSNS